ncbi:transposase [Streptomyces sp. NPDC093071]|uniref:transposase n=1 Tax=Streptomyces sp. NPDC093071 TaxID=3366022 RepID=UPI003805D4BC
MNDDLRGERGLWALRVTRSAGPASSREATGPAIARGPRRCRSADESHDACTGTTAGRQRHTTSRPVPGRQYLQGILYVLINDTARQLLPPELGFGSDQTCRRRLDRWQQAGVFDRLHPILLAGMNAVGELAWSRACVDGPRVREKRGVPIPPGASSRRTVRRSGWRTVGVWPT